MSFKLKKYRLLTLFERALIHLLNARLNALFSSNPSNIKILHTLFFIVIFVFAGLTGWGQTVTTDKLDYAPGETVKITGSGFFPGEIILLEIEHIEPNLPVPFHTHTPWETVADSIGNFNSTWYVDTPELNTTLLLTASGQTSDLFAETKFTDNKSVTIAFTGTGSVTVTSNPSGINASYNNGTTSGTTSVIVGNTVQVTLTALLSPGTTVTSWSVPAYTINSGCGAGNSTCQFTLNNTAQTVTLNLTCAPPPAPTGSATQSFCSSTSPTVASLNATGTGILWYSAPSGGSALATSTVLVNGTHYYASQTVGGCESSTRLDVTATVNVSPTASIISNNSPVCSGSDATFTLTGASGAIVTFNINNGTSSTVTLTGGTATVTVSGATVDQTLNLVSVTDGTCSQSLSGNSTITVNPLPTAAISGINSPVCTGDDAVFTLTGTSGATVTYNVNSGADQTVILSGGTATVTVSGATANQILNLVSVTDGTCSQSLSGNSTVSVYQKPTITLSASNAEVCFGDILASIPYSAKSESPDQYSIDFDAVAEGQGFADILNSTLSGGAIDFAVPAAGVPDSYNAVLTVRNSVTGCVSIPLNISVVIHPLPDTSEIQTN